MYNESGSVISKLVITDEGNITTYYDENGKISSETTSYNEPKDGSIYTQKAYENGKLVYEDKMDENGIFTMKAYYEYDDNGNLKKKTVENQNGDRLIYGKDGKALYFKLKDDDKMYPCLGQWLINKFENGKNIKEDLTE